LPEKNSTSANQKGEQDKEVSCEDPIQTPERKFDFEKECGKLPKKQAKETHQCSYHSQEEKPRLLNVTQSNNFSPTQEISQLQRQNANLNQRVIDKLNKFSQQSN
jgi:hypothetical protein